MIIMKILLDKFKELIEIANKVDTAHYEIDEVLNPTGYIMVAFSVFACKTPKEEEKYLRRMVGWLAQKSPEEILEIPEVKENTESILYDIEFYKDIIPAWATVEDNKIFILDLRGRKETPKIIKF